MARCTTRSVSRIHITLIDLLGDLGRVDGGAGITLEKPYHIVSAEAIEGLPRIEVSGDREGIAERCAREVLKTLCRSCGARVKVKESYDLHIGLGGVTQLCLATARSISLSLGHDIDPIELARITGRGGTSGIGVHAFRSGGFIVDGGHRYPSEKSYIAPSDYVKAPPPPLISRLEIPGDWGFILVIPKTPRRIYGDLERKIFMEASSTSREEIWRVSHIVLMGVIPSIAVGDIELLRRSISMIQDLGFKRIEWKYQSKEVWDVRRKLEELGIGFGLSSMGSTIYIPCKGEECIDIEENVKRVASGDITTIASKGRNRGAESFCE
ncbi:MAG: beta-ribofuranosylaminobenzene 5'-phosphate synthase [Sulfolobales archaeon]